MVIVVSTIASESLPEAAVTLTRYADAGFKQMGKTVATLTRYADAGFKQMGKNLVTFAKVKGPKIAEDVSKVAKWTFDHTPAVMVINAANNIAIGVSEQIETELTDPDFTENTRKVVGGGVARIVGELITKETLKASSQMTSSSGGS